MKKDILSVVFGTLIMFIFVIFMFNSFNDSQEIKLIEKQLQLDSTFLDRQRILEKNDSLLHLEQQELKKLLNYQNSELKKLDRKVESYFAEY